MIIMIMIIIIIAITHIFPPGEPVIRRSSFDAAFKVDVIALMEWRVNDKGYKTCSYTNYTDYIDGDDIEDCIADGAS